MPGATVKPQFKGYDVGGGGTAGFQQVPLPGVAAAASAPRTDALSVVDPHQAGRGHPRRSRGHGADRRAGRPSPGL